jgi:predicted component of viral defense system (DUF524 family)
MKIYDDSSRERVAHSHLIENKTYYVDFEEAADNEIDSEIKASKLTNFVDWQRGNRFATLNITNFIGNIYFAGKTYDVKSSKFLAQLSGTEQFQTILSEIQELSKNVIFSYSSPSFVLRQVDYNDVSPTLLLMFNYFKRIILDWDSSINLESVLNRIINNPHFKYAVEHQIDRIEKVKVIDGKMLRSLVRQNKDYVMVDDDRADLVDLPITRFVSQNSPENYFPQKSLMKKKYLSLDTPENRFIKFFVEYIEGVAYRLNEILSLPSNVLEEKDFVLSFCRTTLNMPFFRGVGQMDLMPIHSAVLQSRVGYRDILSHFTRSRFGIKHVFEEFEQEALSIDLKRISDLYEYWVFYKIAIAFLGEEIIIEQQDVVLKGGEVSYGVCFKNESISVYFNWTESRARESAYSVTLRPDTTVVINHGGKAIKLIFDAKYRVRNKEGVEGIERHVKKEDLYKMHTYLDAIEGCMFAVAIYPGSEMYFYERDLKKSVRRDVKSIDVLEGVGAIPLVPHDAKLNDQFICFVEFVKSNFGIN